MSENSQTTQESTKVVNLFAKKGTDNTPTKTTSSGERTADSQDSQLTSGDTFSDAIRKNMENADRLKKERLKANQGVLKSYRIKN